MPADLLAGLLLGRTDGRGGVLFLRGQLTAWDGVTFRNTVAVGSVTYTDLPVLNAAAVALGPVLLGRTDGRPILLGPLSAYTPPETGD